jgi:hypothetical protein
VCVSLCGFKTDAIEKHTQHICKQQHMQHKHRCQREKSTHTHSMYANNALTIDKHNHKHVPHKKNNSSLWCSTDTIPPSCYCQLLNRLD